METTTKEVIKKMLVLHLFILSVGCALGYVEYDIDQAGDLFEQFIQKYNRAYKDDVEKQMRFNIFVGHLQDINRSNKQHGYNVMGINHFADVSKEEFSVTHHGFVYNVNEGPCKYEHARLSLRNLPENFDWRDKGVVTDVKDQGTCSGCWAFSVSGNLESHYAIKHGADKLVSLSEQQLIDCLSGNSCSGGVMSNAILALNDNSMGVMSEADYPFMSQDSKCSYDQTKVKVNVTGCIDYTGSDEEAIRNLLVSTGPLTIGLAGAPLQTYTKGVFKHCNVTARIDHGLLLVGYGTDEETKDPYWLIKNSWGKDYGEDGYVRVVRGNADCKVGQTQLISAEVE